ncbi:MAG: hotdog fold thioesterase, partial [Clostridia bacterium]
MTDEGAMNQPNQMVAGTLMEALGMEVEVAEPDRVRIRMPVDQRTRQPFGILHGGASVALAESAASLATWLNVDQEHQLAVGIEINANHIRPKREGVVFG